MSTMKYSAVVVAGGKGVRANLGYNKVFKKINGRPLLEYALSTFKEDSACKALILVVHPDDQAVAKRLFSKMCDAIVIGGKTRKESVYNGLNHVKTPYVMIHDGARPFISTDVLRRLKEGLVKHDSLSPAIKISDTLKRVEHDRVVDTLSRENLVGIQTPQAFKTEAITKAHRMAHNVHTTATCDMSLASEMLAIQGIIVEGDMRSMKYTHESDGSLMELILNDTHRTES